MVQIDPTLLEILVCPENKQPVRLADEATMERIKAAQAAGKLTNRSGDIVEQPIEGALVRQDGEVFYPIIDGIPVMLIDEAIAINQV